MLNSRVTRRRRYLWSFAALAGLIVNVATAHVAHTEEDSQRISYMGVTVTVPAAWPVYDLAADPTRCVRFDQHAVYLGHPTTEQNCPSHIVGRTEALLMEPADDTWRSRTQNTYIDSESGMLQTLFAEQGVAMTASFGDNKDLALSWSLLGSPVVPAEPTIAADNGAASGSPTRHSAPVATGQGFDTCSAPSREAMSAWLASPYRTVGIYVGGINRACPDGNLSPGWVSDVQGYGYQFIPIYVGRQAPCTTRTWARITNPAPQGVAAADDAVQRMKHFGFSAGNPVYLDLENYKRDAACTHTVLTYITAWVNRLHEHGYVAGVYSSAASGIMDLVNAYNSANYTRPDAIWFAQWNNTPDVATRYVPDSHWSDHQRLHQYTGGHHETYAGVTINIDSNYLDGPVGTPQLG